MLFITPLLRTYAKTLKNDNTKFNAAKELHGYIAAAAERERGNLRLYNQKKIAALMYNSLETPLKYR